MNPITQILSIACAALAILAGLFAYLYNNEVKDHANFRAEVESANAAVAEANRVKIEQAEQNTVAVAEAYASNSARIERELNSRLAGLRREASHCATLSRVAASAQGVDAGTADSRSDSDSYAEVCNRLERDCAKTTLMVFGLQDYVRGVCK